MRKKGPLAPFLDLLNDERRNLQDVVPEKLEQVIHEHLKGWWITRIFFGPSSTMEFGGVFFLRDR